MTNNVFNYKKLPQELKDMVLQRALPTELRIAYQLCARPDNTSPGYILRAINFQDLTTLVSLQQVSRTTKEHTLGDLQKHIKENLTLVVDFREDLVRDVATSFDIDTDRVPESIYKDVRHIRFLMPLAIETPAIGDRDPMLWLLTINVKRIDDTWDVDSHEFEVKLNAQDPQHRTNYDTGIANVLSVIQNLIHRDLRGALTRWRLERIINVLWTGNVTVYNQMHFAANEKGWVTFGVLPKWQVLDRVGALGGWNAVVHEGRRYPGELERWTLDRAGFEVVPMTREERQETNDSNNPLWFEGQVWFEGT